MVTLADWVGSCVCVWGGGGVYGQLGATDMYFIRFVGV